MKAPLKPHITEKTYVTIEATSSTGSTYTFRIDPSLTKEQVKKLVEKAFQVSVVSVNIINLPGKVRRFKGIAGKTSAVKKAVVRLKKGDAIPAFDIEEDNQEKE